MKQLLVLTALIIVKLCKAQLNCTNGTVRLLNGPSKFEGRVEVCLSEEWRTVCNDFWGQNEAMVVCRQLGFATSGTERFIDLRSTGGPDVGIDNSNCTGTEERLVDCNFSREVSDCNSNAHKVGVRCHEEREPRNLRLSTNEMFLKVDWDAPERGVTNDQIQGYVVACSFLEGNEAYTLEHRVSFDVLEAYLPIRNLSRSAYNCCVEAAFDTYSSKACIATPSQLNVDDSIQQRSICPSNQSIEAVAGALTSVIVILLIILLVAITALVYMWRRVVIKQSREEQSKTMPKAHSGTETGGRALDNQKYGEQESSMVALTKTPLGRYSSTGPEYEPIHQTAEIKRGGNQPVNRGHRLLPESRLNLRPASYEIPISSSTQTLNINK